MEPKTDRRRAPVDNGPPKLTPIDIAQQHEMRVYRAYQLARPVRIDGKNQYIKAIYSQDGIFTEVYIAGNPKPYKPEEIEIVNLKGGQSE